MTHNLMKIRWLTSPRLFFLNSPCCDSIYTTSSIIQPEYSFYKSYHKQNKQMYNQFLFLLRCFYHFYLFMLSFYLINIIFIQIMSLTRKSKLPIFVILSILLVYASAFTYSNFEFTDSNQGAESHYIFSFTPSLSYDNVEVTITFPIEYSVSSFAGSLQCFFSRSGRNDDYISNECWVQPDSTANSLYLLGSVVVDVTYANSTEKNYILLKNVVNPLTNLSSYFQVCLRKNGVKLQCMKYFSKAVFSPISALSNQGISITPFPSPTYIGRGTSYVFEFKIGNPSLLYISQNLRIRIKLPAGFSTDGPQCSIGDYDSLGFKDQYIPLQTRILPQTLNQVDCGPITTLGSMLGPNKEVNIKIDNMLNSYDSNTYTDFQVQIVRELYMQPVETILFPNSSITIIPENLQVQIKQSNYMRISTNVYYFMLNHYTDLNQSSSITVEFLSDVWTLYGCFAVNGFTSPSTLQCQITGNKIKLYNYGNASSKVQQIFGVNLTSFNLSGQYPVQLTTQISNEKLGEWTGNVTLNQTIGTYNLLSISAVQAATKLPVGNTGPLQMTFFLNYQLPPSGDVPNGSLQITIVPQIPEPDPEINGVVKCYWKGTLQAADCTYDNSVPNKTIITLISPPLDAFKYSQIPVIITTQGGTNTSNLGLTIDPLVQRYRFECAFHLYNSSVIPSEVFYTTWIADAIELKSGIVFATSHECQEYTHLQINFTTPLLDSSLPKQFRIMVQFLNDDGSAWAPSVGYEINKIYQRYPCVVVGLVGTNIHCDLYTYYQAVTPYSNMHINNNISGPYILIYGFDQNIPTGIPVRLEIPKIKLGSTVGAKALLGLSILQETPGQKQPYVELYYQDIIAFTTLPPISIPLSPEPTSQLAPIQIQTFNQYHVQWTSSLPSNVRYITYEITPQFLPTLINQDGVCTPKVCVGFGLPANWIVQTVSSVTNPYSMDTLSNYIQAMYYLPQTTTDLPIRMFTYDGNGNTINKYSMNIHYTAKLIPTASFDFLETTVYSGLEQWYSISFANTNSTMTDYPFMRFTLRNGLSFSDPPQCNSTTILPFNESGIICIRQNAQTMRVHNIKTLTPLGTYNMWFRMQTTLSSHTTAISPDVEIHLNYNNSIDSSIVSFKQNLVLTQAPVLPALKAPQKFEIHNPQIVNQDIQIGYIGPLYLQFMSQTSGVYDIDVEFANHLYNGGFWRTPTKNNLDPVVCFLNQIRYDCTPVNAPPLKISVIQISVVAGLNQIRFDTEYIDPFNGIKFPDVPGMYSIKLTVKNTTAAASVTIYAQIQPPKFLHMQAGSIVKDINTETVFKVNFTLPSWHVYPNSYFDTANYSIITIEFPTLINDQTVFTQNLGLYSGQFQERVGCYFKTGGNFVTFAPTYTIQCRLIPSKKLGEPVKVQIINHAAFSATQNSLSVYIFKVLNPALPHSSVPITVKIDHVQVGTGYVFPLYKQTYRVFLDPRSQNTAPATYPSVDSSSMQFFDPLKDVGDYGPIFLNAHTVSGNPIVQPYHLLVKLPKYFIPEDNQVATAFSWCPASAFVQCISVPQINYLMIKSNINISQYQALIKNYPISISLRDSFFYTNVIQAGRWTGIIQYNISAAFRWQQIQGKLTYTSSVATGLQSKIIKNKDHFEIVVTFKTKNFIPETGTIQIGFPPSVTNVQPHCRSSAQLVPGLLARSGASGQIGCMVQNINKWVITGFANVLPGTTIAIRGQVDLPTVSGTIGTGQIITYADNDLVDIYSNGSRIDYIKTDFNLILIDSFAMNPIQDVFMTQRDVIRAGFVGEFRILLESALPLANTDTIKLRMAQKDIRGTSGGFTQSARPKVCQFIRIDTNQQIGCKVTSEQTDSSISGQEAIEYILQPTQTLLSSVRYEIRLTSQSYVEPALLEGIPYPSSPGTYKIQTISVISGVQKIQHRYIQVYGPAFTQLKVTQYNYLAGEYNLIWVEFVPTVPITPQHQIIVEFPTLSSNGTTMFDNNLGLNGYKDGQQVPVDIFDSTPLDNNYMKCRIYFGDQTRGVPVRVVCGFLASTLASPSYLRFAFGFTNPPRITIPSIPSQISLPLIVYSYDPFYFEKTNFNLVNAAVLVYNGQNILAPNGYFGTTSNQLQFPNDDLLFGDAHTFPLLIGQAYVMRFKFPLRVNDKQPGLCKKIDNVTVYGDAYYHQRLGIIVCKVTTTTIPAMISPLTQSMMISEFYTPWYRLADSERIVSAIATYSTTSTSQVINYFDLFPHLLPRYQFSNLSTLTLQGHIKHYTACQSDDYIFRVLLEAPGSANLDLQYCKMISINLPLTTVIDYYTLNTDCVEHPDSQIHVIRCNIDLSARAIFVEIVPGTYTNGLMIAVKTKDHALRNPCVFWSAFDIKKFTVLFYSWENITYADTRSPDYAYMVMDLRNLNAFTLSYARQEYPAGMFSYYYTFDWIHTPHERFYRQFPQYTTDQFSPFSFDIWLMAALPTPAVGQFHKIKLTYGNNYVTRDSQWTFDLNYDKTVCYLDNNRIQRCVLDTTNKLIYMLVDFAIPAGKPIHVYFSILDPKQPERNGFRYIGSSDIDKVVVELTQATGAIQIFETQPFMAKQTQVGGTGGPLPQRGIRYATIDWATSMTNQLNVLDITLHVNRSDITALQFIIPLRNEINQVVYSANSRSAFFDIQDGGEYPCGNNNPGSTDTGNPKCFIYNGDNTEMGFPTIITMQDISYTGSVIKARLLFYNPDVNTRWFTVKVRAYSGTPDPQSVFGHQFVGYWYFVNIFRTQAGTYTSASAPNQATSYWLAPNKGNWRQNTTWIVQGATAGGNTMAALPGFDVNGLGFGGYAIVQVPIYENTAATTGYSDKSFCEVNFYVGDSNSDDMLILKSKQNGYTKAYFIKKWVSSPWLINYFKCKHYGRGLVSYMYPSRIIMEKDLHTFSTVLNSFYPIVGSMFTIDYFQFIQGRALLQFNLATMLNAIEAEKFIWDDQVDYELNIDLVFYTAVTWTSVSSCYVTGGFQNTKGGAPNCFMRSAYSLTVRGFQNIMTRVLGSRTIKIQLDTNDLVNPPNSLGANLALYANSDANLVQQFIYSTSTSITYSRTLTYPIQLITGSYCGVAYGFSTVSYNSHTSTDLRVDVLNFGLSSTSVLDVKLRLRPAAGTSFSMYWSGYESYPWLRFYIQGYDYTCNGINRMRLTYINSVGGTSTYNALGWAGTRCGFGFFEVQFQPSGVSLSGGGWSGLSTFTTAQWIQVDAQFAITASQMPYLRDWVGIRASINTYYYTYCCSSSCSCCCCGWCSCATSNLYYCYTYLVAVSEQAHSYINLADSLTLDAISYNVGLPTQMFFTIIQIYPQIGHLSVDKILLLQFNTGTHPFNYINATANNVPIQCRCITSWASTFNPSSTVIPNCVLRLPQLTFVNFAITVDIDVAPDQNLQCYFPGWQPAAPFSYQVTAKLINQGSSYPPWVQDSSVYGGFYWIPPTTTLTFSSLAAPGPITFTENPTIYSAPQTVKLFWTSSYSLSLTIPSTILQPIVYIDFQNSGFIPDQSFCSSSAVFTYCRVYSTLRNIIVAQFITPVSTSTVTFTKGSSNLQFPKHKQYLANNDIVAYMRSGSLQQYTFAGRLSRSSADLLSTTVQFYAFPEKSTSTNLQGKRSNLILSFNMGGQTLFSTPTQGAKIVITDDSGLLVTARGCTASSVDDTSFDFDCVVSGGSITVTNPSYTRTLSVSGLLQVVVGVLNPSTPVTFTLRSYEYFISSSNYGEQILTTTIYQTNPMVGTQQLRTQIRMQPFTTKVYSTVHTPFRIAFKISNSPPSLPDNIDWDLSYKMVLSGFDQLSTFTNFECLFKQFTLQPSEKIYSPQPNSYRNWKQYTQFIPLYSFCNLVGTNLQIQAPRTKPLSINNYYELVVMPTGTGLTQTGFPNAYDADFRLITYPDSCEYIGQYYGYEGPQMNLLSMYLVTSRPLVSTALQLHFQLLFSSGVLFPNHYFQIHFQDLNYNSIRAPYNQVGMKVPCTLSSQFVTAGRQNGPYCIVNYVHESHKDLILRVVEIGNLPVSNTYKISLDDFLLPDLSALLEPSNQFSVCLRFHNQPSNIHYQRCFEEIFVIDGELNTIPVINNVGTFQLPAQNAYAASVTGNLQFTYPMTSTSLIDQKSMARVNGGYSATSVSPISFGSHTLLWYNPMINLYILKQPVATIGAASSITVNGLTNPEPYQKEEYSYINTIEMTYYGGYHPNNYYIYSQPPYSYFVLYSSLVQLTTTYASDIRIKVPTDSQSIVKMGITITESVASLTTKLTNVFEITFNSADISEVEQCWVESVTTAVPYRYDGWCQTTTDGRVFLYNFYQSNVNVNLVLFVRLRHIATNIRVVSKLYSDNGEIQYNDTYSFTNSKINLGVVNHPLLSFTQNHYTVYYFEQAITPLTISSTCKYMYFSLNLPKDLQHALSIFSITLPTTIIPSNLIEPLQRCQWLLADRYNRQFHTGVYSACSYIGGKIIITVPYGGLLAFSSGTTQYSYLLKVRELDVINTHYLMPSTSKPEEILFALNDTNIFKYDTLIIHPYEHFTSFAPFMYTLNVDELNTYHMEFIPAATIAPGYEAVLQLSIDTRYLVKDLGMPAVFSNYGVNYNNQTRIDNLNYNIKYDIINNKWINGAPYTCYSSTLSLANQTTIHTGSGLNNKRTRITHLLQKAYVGATKYIWKVPLLLNPSTLDLPFRMNLTLWTYQATGVGIGQKQLFYQIINHKFTKPNNPTPIPYTIPNPNRVQVVNANISVRVTTLADVPHNWQYVELKLNNQLTGIIGLNNLQLYSEGDASYTFYFFPRVNLLMAHKKIQDFSQKIDLGAAQISNQYADYYGFDWLKVHSSTTQNTVRKQGSVTNLLTNCIVNPITAFAIAQGINNIKDSEFLLTMTLVNTNCWIPRNSTLIINYNQAVLEGIIKSPCYITFRKYSCSHGLGQIQVTFYEKILAGTTITMKFYLRAIGTPVVSTTLTGYIYGIPGTKFTKVFDFPNFGTLNVDTDNLIDTPLFQHIQTNYIYEDSQMDIRGTIIPNNPATYIDITHPFTSSLASIQRMIIRQNSTSPYLFDYRTDLKWFQTLQKVISNVENIETIPPNGLITYNIISNKQYTFIMEATYDVSGALNNYTVGKVGSYYQFQYLTENQIAYDEVYPIPVAEHLTIINPFTQVSQETAVGFKFSVKNYTIVPGNRITIQLDTYNLRYDMFRKSSQYSVECVQRIKGILTWQPILVCQVTQQPTPTNPNQALIITIYPKLSVPANTILEIWLSPIFNPDIVMVSGATVRVDKDCNGKKRCVIYESRGYYRTTTGMNVINNLTGSFTPSNTQVLMSGVSHTFTLLPDTYSAVFFRYPENYNTFMPLKCGETIANDCLIFPTQKRVLSMLPNAATSSITLTGMNNGIYLQPGSVYFDVLALTPTSANFYEIPHNNLTTRRQIPATGAPTWMTITPTQTPGIFLRNYMNTVTIQLYGLYSTKFVNAFYINAPKQIVTWDTKYCNATFESLNNDPYPTRLLCSFINDTTMQILIQEGVQEIYLNNITQQFIMTVQAKFFIQDFAPGDGILYVTQPVISGTFNAYGSYSTTNYSYPYYITQASTPITISEHRVPIIGKADFNTDSYMERIPDMNENTTFELLIDPITTEQVKRIQFVIPEEFGYPPVGVHDACSLITTDVTQVSGCYEIRKNNKTIISLQLVDNYDNGPRILKIGSVNEANWFVAPNMPGSWYNFSVLMYSANGTLLEAQTTSNCSEIGGLDLSMPDIVVTNGRDQNKNEIVDISFVVGNVSIRRGYPDGLNSGQYYTQIRIIFENLKAYARDLGLDRKQDQLTGCTTRNIVFTRQIACALNIGLNVNDEPYISITGYQPIIAGTNVTISLANILNLPLTQRSTVSIAVMLHRVNDSRIAFLYDQTKKVLMSTSALSTVLPTQLSIVYNSPRITNNPTILNFTITPTVDINSYFVLKFPKDGLNDEYKLFSPSCSLASRIDVFYRSDVVRIYPSTPHLAGTSRSYVITGFPTPLFAFGPLSWNITVEAYRNLKQANTQTYTISNFQIATCKLSFGLLTTTSPYTFDTDVSYVFEFVINSTSSSTQNSITIGLKFPDIFGDIRLSSMTCVMNSNASCQFTRPNYLQITGTRQSGVLVHKLTLNHVNNPQTLANIFYISSYIGQNIENQICSGQAQLNLMKSTTQFCTLDVNSEHLTKIESTVYNFGFTCPDIIRNNSVAYIKLPNTYASNNMQTLPCWADFRDNLITQTCPIKYINGSYYIEVVNIIINKNQKAIGINVQMNNPVTTGSYNFTANLTVLNFTYGLTSTDNITIYDGATQAIQSIQLINQPKESGIQSYYFLRMPTSSINSSLDFGFPPEFQLPPSVQIQRFTSNSSTWASTLKYSDILNLSGLQLNSQVITTDGLNQKIHIDNTNTGNLSSTNSWTYFMIKSIRNPPYQSQTNFTLNTYYDFGNSQRLLIGQADTNLNYTLSPPAGDILHTNISVIDNDVLYFTNYTLTYRLRTPHQTNQTTIYITPPITEMNYALLALNCCIVVNSSGSAPYTYCNNCTIIKQTFKFTIVPNGIKIPADTDFQIKLMGLYNPPNATDCTLFQHHQLSYFKLMILKNDLAVTHTGMPPTNMESPCQIYRVLRADILPTLPGVVYAGMVHNFTVRLSSPTKMLRVVLNCTDPLVTFIPNILFFPTYDVVQLSGQIVVSSVAQNNSAYVNITHQESGTFDFFRPNLPIPIQIIANHKEYVIVQEQKAKSVGYDITVPIKITFPSSVDMYMQIEVVPEDPNLIFNSTEILLPAFSNESSFTFRYNGKKIPPTFNLSFTLKSQYPLVHELKPPQAYLYFTICPSHNTLPPLMDVEVLYQYRNNSNYTGKTVYHYNNTGFLYYDKILPLITSHIDQFVGSTSASVLVHTRQEATVAYLIYQYGDHLVNKPQTPADIRNHPNSVHFDTKKNSTLIVNPYNYLNLTKLQQQTQYFIYLMAYSTLGNSVNITTHTFTTKVLSNAASFKLITKKYELTDEVNIVRALADILKIDPYRIKVVSSEKVIAKSFYNNKTQNLPYYEQMIVVSPSNTEDDIPSQQIILDRLMQSQFGRERLQELIPNWIGRFNNSQLKLENRVKPILRETPVAKRISYYNATFEVRYWAKARIYATLIQFMNQTLETLNYTESFIKGIIVNVSSDPTIVKQIVKGVDSKNFPVDRHYTALCNKAGYATIFFDELMPGSKYIMYVAATSPEIYEPKIYSDYVTKTEFYTLWNPNLRNKEKLVLNELKKFKPEMYEAIKEYYENQEKKLNRAGSIRK